MANNKTIRVRTSGSAMVPDYEAMEAGLIRFHGWKHDPSLGELAEVQEGRKKRKMRSGGFVQSESLSLELPFRAEYVQEVQAGTLVPLDEESAQLCGVSFQAA